VDCHLLLAGVEGLSSPFRCPSSPGAEDSHFTGVKPPKMFPFVSDIKVRMFARPSQRRWNSLAPKPSWLPRHNSSKRFMRNS
jgi:hypothetical protein